LFIFSLHNIIKEINGKGAKLKIIYRLRVNFKYLTALVWSERGFTNEKINEKN